MRHRIFSVLGVGGTQLVSILFGAPKCLETALNAGNYSWLESRSKVCQTCDMGHDETVAHVILEYKKYDHDIMEIVRMILNEMGRETNEVIDRTRREWIVLCTDN